MWPPSASSAATREGGGRVSGNGGEGPRGGEGPLPPQSGSSARQPALLACESEQQHVVILVRNKGLHPLD